MKKFLLIMAMLFGCMSITYSQSTMWFRTTKFAYKYVNDYGYWTNWSDWQRSNVKIMIDTNNDKIVIYSKEVQIYKIIERLEDPYDDKGTQVKFRVVDQDYDFANLRLRVENSGSSQLYVDYNNLSFVYVVVREN